MTITPILTCLELAINCRFECKSLFLRWHWTFRCENDSSSASPEELYPTTSKLVESLLIPFCHSLVYPFHLDQMKIWRVFTYAFNGLEFYVFAIWFNRNLEEETNLLPPWFIYISRCGFFSVVVRSTILLSNRNHQVGIDPQTKCGG